MDLHYRRLQKAIPALRLYEAKASRQLHLSLDKVDLFSASRDGGQTDLSIKNTIDAVVSRWGSLSDQKLNTDDDMTGPMRRLLRKERVEKISLYNAPIYFGF